MKRIHSIDLKHFKAFQDSPPIELGGHNLLLYGPNGSGKSSIYWALYTFLQSSQKHRTEVEKYFDPSHRESLVNVDMGSDASSSIVLHIGQDTDTSSTAPVRIALDAHETPVPDLQHANMASDFVTYRVLFRFYHFSNREEIDLWPVFSREILPFCSAPVVGHVGDRWADVWSDDPYQNARESGARGKTAAKIYDDYDLLISLDMSNRTQVIKVILSDPDFADYQKIIMTHDLGFYREVRRAIGPEHGNWVFQRLHASDGHPPSIVDDPERIDWAASLMQEGRYDDAALQLRKASEDFLRDFVKKAYSPEKFVSLTTLVNDARIQNDLFLLKKLFAVLEGWEEETDDALDRLLPPDMDDLKSDCSLSPEKLGEHCRSRADLRNLIKELHGHHRRTGQILEQIEHIKDRILNPAAHAGDPPLYASEIEDAFGLIRQLKHALAVS